MHLSLEWGPTGAAALASSCDVAVVVDVLTFSTTVTVATDRGVWLRPYRWAATAARDEARLLGATLAVPRGAVTPGQVSLSPATFRAAGDLTRVVLPSPNGSTICTLLAEAGADVVVASLRNRRAVADHLLERASRVLMVAAGERWPDDSLRPAIEDLWGAGGVASAILDADQSATLTDETLAAVAAYRLVKDRLAEALLRCPSGQELSGMGYASDVTIAAELDSSTSVPTLEDGWLVAS